MSTDHTPSGSQDRTASDLRRAIATLVQEEVDIDRAWGEHLERFSRRRFRPRSTSNLSLSKVLTFAAVILAVVGLIAFGSVEAIHSSGTAKPPTSKGRGKLMPSPNGGGKFTVQVTLSTTRVVAGTKLKGDVVVNNPGKTLNLTELDTGPNKGCQPAFLVYLENKEVDQGGAFGLPCSSAPFLVRHGLSIWPFTVETTYEGCLQPNGSSSIPVPACLANLDIPPLPPGKYSAEVLWSSKVPLPTARAATVTLLPSSSNPCGAGTVAIDVTKAAVIHTCVQAGSELMVWIGPEMTNGKWLDGPRTGDPAILRFVSSGSSDSSLAAYFVSVKAGSTTVTGSYAASMTGCSPTPCTPIPMVPLTIDVTVVSASGP
jgi:hypothetical protein